MLTSRDVARIAGVSQTTVSRVLNGSDKVRPATRERVMAALSNYRPNASARAMRTNRTNTIGVVASHITNPYFPELMQAISAAANDNELRILLWTDDDPSLSTAIDGARMGLVDGLCITTASAATTGISLAAELDIPLVLLNRGYEPHVADEVTSDRRQIGELAADYLLGCDIGSVGMISGADDVAGIPESRAAFLDTLRNGGVAVPDRWSAQGDFTFRTGYDAVHRMAEQGPLPRAIFCGNDLIAFGAMSALRHLNIRVPEDIWLIGVDDLPMSSWEVFDLTTIRQPIVDMAERGIHMLHERIGGEAGEPRRVLLDVELVVRGSTDNRQAPRR